MNDNEPVVVGNCMGCGLEFVNGQIRPKVDGATITSPLDTLTVPVAGGYAIAGEPSPGATGCSSLHWTCDSGEMWAEPEPCCQRLTLKDQPIIKGGGTRVGGTLTRSLALCGDCSCKPDCMYVFGCVRLCATASACRGWRIFGTVSVAGRSCQIADGVKVEAANLGQQSRDISIMIQALVKCSDSVPVTANLTATNWNTTKPIEFDVTGCYDLTVLHVDC